MGLKLSAVFTLQLASIVVLVNFETLLSPFRTLAIYFSSFNELFLHNGH